MIMNFTERFYKLPPLRALRTTPAARFFWNESIFDRAALLHLK
jgi:hypothetical protein